METEISVFTDGGAIGNPGPAASAFVVWQANQIIRKEVRKIGVGTNNVAEYQAVIFALEWLKEKSNDSTIQPLAINFYLDSQLVVNQLNGLYKIKDAKLRILVLKIRELEQNVKGKILYQLIPREKNKLADALIKNVLVFSKDLL